MEMLPWCAGIIDGEGGISLSKIGCSRVQLYMTVPTTSKAVVSRLQDTLGGNVNPGKRETETQRAQWVWATADGDVLKKALVLLRPWLVVKGRHADLALQFLDECWSSSHGHYISQAEESRRLWYYSEMSRLQIKGKYSKRNREFQSSLQPTEAQTPFADPRWVGWAAGIIEGEGTIQLIAGGNKHQVNLNVEVRMTNTEAVIALSAVLGGRSKPLNDTNGVRNDKRPQWTWLIQNARAVEALLKVQPFAVEKGRQIELALEFWNTCSHPKGYNKKLSDAEVDRRFDFMHQLQALHHDRPQLSVN